MVATTSRVSPSRVPNPSSRKMESSRAAPAAASAEICDDRASASARDAWKVSPPDRVRTERRGIGVGVVDDEQVALVVGEVELAARQRGKSLRGGRDQVVQGLADQPLRELPGLQQVAEHMRDLLLLLGGPLLLRQVRGLGAAFRDAAACWLWHLRARSPPRRRPFRATASGGEVDPGVG